MGKYHNILYVALKTAWNWSIKDSTSICALLSKNSHFGVAISQSATLLFRSYLDEIYECERTFERLFLGAIFGTNAPYFIAGWRSDFKDQVKWKFLRSLWNDLMFSFSLFIAEQDENSRAAVFFLHHASQQRLQFEINGYDIP